MIPLLPTTRDEMADRGWDELDVLLVTGDAYIDHPAFGAALLGRWLEDNGLRVGMVAQPRWDTPDDVARMGRPRLFAGVTSGALDSMLAHYTAFRKKRSDDAYTPGGQAGARPNRATIVYTGLVKQAFPGLPVIIGGIEASMRRAVHFDFWTGKLRRSILLNSKADLLIYGMAETALLETARRLERGGGTESLCDIPGTAFVLNPGQPLPCDAVEATTLASFEDIESEPARLMEATLAIEALAHRGAGWSVQSAGERRVVFTPPAPPLGQNAMDRLYGLPFTRRAHPAYSEPVPALEMVAWSITTHRGCAGGCSFCSLAMHQGRAIQSRSEESVVDEAQSFSEHSGYRGAISDVGGPSANMYGSCCHGDRRACNRRSCLTPTMCPNFSAPQVELSALLKTLSDLPGTKSVRVASGVRFDLAMKDPQYISALVRNHVGGQLKVAPEHITDKVLRLMRKPSFHVFQDFLELFQRESSKAGKDQFIVPYLMSAFPGCADDDMRTLRDWLSSRGWRPQQVQCFIPTPGTVATAMFHARIDPQGHPIPVARTDAERLRQHHILLGNDIGTKRTGQTRKGGARSKRRRRS